MSDFIIRSLSPQESRVVLAFAERDEREIARQDIISLLKTSPGAADQIIRSLRQKGWLERASWGKYLLIPPDHGPEAIGESNVLALASQIADPYYIGYGTAATHYGFTTQHRNTLCLVTQQQMRDRHILNTHINIVNPTKTKFFGYHIVNILGSDVQMSDREKTAIDCVDRPDLAGGVGEAAYILARASRKFDWTKLSNYLERMSSIALLRKIGWLFDYIGTEVPYEVRENLNRKATTRRSSAVLGPKNPRENALGYQSKWKLTVNVPERELAEAKGLGKRRSLPRKD